jgi:regulator of replication initiation timing
MKDLENQNQDVKRHIQRSMDANTLLSQQLDLVKNSLKKSQFHKEARNEPRNGKSILGASNSVLVLPVQTG